MNLNIKIGDATNPPANDDVSYWILHGCNSVGAWGSGFVIALNKRFGTDNNSPVSNYHRWFEKNPPTLGDIQMVKVNNNDFVINMITQKGCGPVMQNEVELGIPFRYEAFEECLRRVKYFAEKFYDKYGKYPHLVSPRIGCGLALADWNEVENIIDYVFYDTPIEWTVYDLPQR
jgi:O-acetyl-ADP-ribose deacetylase (regulator of RNase III)